MCKNGYPPSEFVCGTYFTYLTREKGYIHSYTTHDLPKYPFTYLTYYLASHQNQVYPKSVVIDDAEAKHMKEL